MTLPPADAGLAALVDRVLIDCIAALSPPDRDALVQVYVAVRLAACQGVAAQEETRQAAQRVLTDLAAATWADEPWVAMLAWALGAWAAGRYADVAEALHARVDGPTGAALLLALAAYRGATNPRPKAAPTTTTPSPSHSAP